MGACSLVGNEFLNIVDQMVDVIVDRETVNEKEGYFVTMVTIINKLLTFLFDPFLVSSVTSKRSFRRINCIVVQGFPLISSSLNVPWSTKYLLSLITSLHFCCLVYSESDYKRDTVLVYSINDNEWVPAVLKSLVVC